MSSAKLLLSGFLVAGGLILGAFTLHGYFDPQWPQKSMHAAREPAQEPKSIYTFETRTQVVAAAPPEVVTSSGKPDVKPADVLAAEAKAAAAKAAARKKRAEQRLAEKAEKEKIEKAKQAPQQAGFQWPWKWNWFSN